MHLIAASFQRPYIQSKLSRINFATQDKNQNVYYKHLFTIVCINTPSILVTNCRFLLHMKVFHENFRATNESKPLCETQIARHV